MLAACGLSGAKAASIRDLAEKVVSGQIALDRIGRLTDEDVVAHLCQVRGIGPWTADMFLLGTLARLDVWPTGDYGVRAGFARAWDLPQIPTPKELAVRGEPFRPYRSLVAWYCWRAADDRMVLPGDRADPPECVRLSGRDVGCHSALRQPRSKGSRQALGAIRSRMLAGPHDPGG